MDHPHYHNNREGIIYTSIIVVCEYIYIYIIAIQIELICRREEEEFKLFKNIIVALYATYVLYVQLKNPSRIPIFALITVITQ